MWRRLTIFPLQSAHQLMLRCLIVLNEKQRDDVSITTVSSLTESSDTTKNRKKHTETRLKLALIIL